MSRWWGAGCSEMEIVIVRYICGASKPGDGRGAALSPNTHYYAEEKKRKGNPNARCDSVLHPYSIHDKPRGSLVPVAAASWNVWPLACLEVSPHFPGWAERQGLVASVLVRLTG